MWGRRSWISSVRCLCGSRRIGFGCGTYLCQCLEDLRAFEMRIEKREGHWLTIWELIGGMISTGTHFEVMAILAPTDLRNVKEWLEYTLTDDLARKIGP